MKKRISIVLILAVAARVQAMGNAGSPASPLGIAELLVPLKEESHSVQKKIKAFSSLLRQDAWEEETLKKVIVEYRELASELDMFPLRYRPLLEELRLGYPMDMHAASLFHDSATLIKEVSFGLFKYMSVMFDVEKAFSTFKSVRSSMRYQEIPLPPFSVTELKNYQNWSSAEYKGLQNYLNGTANVLFKQVKEKKMYQGHQQEMVQEQQRLDVLEIELEQQEQEVPDLKEILTTFTLAGKAVQDKAEKKQVEDHWFLAGLRKKWLVPQFPSYHVEHTVRF